MGTRGKMRKDREMAWYISRFVLLKGTRRKKLENVGNMTSITISTLLLPGKMKEKEEKGTTKDKKYAVSFLHR